jgi:hypothetical protein
MGNRYRAAGRGRGLTYAELLHLTGRKSHSS